MSSAFSHRLRFFTAFLDREVMCGSLSLCFVVVASVAPAAVAAITVIAVAVAVAVAGAGAATQPPPPSATYVPTVTEPEALLDHQEGLLLRNRWLHWLSLLLLMRDCHGESGTPKWIDYDPVTTRLAQTSWARPGRVVSCDMLACPSAQDSFTGCCEDVWRDFWDTSGFLQFRMFRIMCSK